jgi:hypothetical protein
VDSVYRTLCSGVIRNGLSRGARIEERSNHWSIVPQEVIPVTNPIPGPSLLVCAICDKPCDLETCKTDEHGNAVHEECVAAKFLQRSKTPSTSISQQ